MKIFTREIIENFAKPVNQQSYEKAFEWLETFLVDIVEKLKTKTPVLNETYELILVGDMLSETSTPNSALDVFLAFKAPQLELNSIKLSEDKFKRFWLRLKKAYTQAREEKKSKRKKKKKNTKIEKEFEIPANKYSILNLKKQLILSCARTLEVGGIIVSKNSHFKIVARDELGIDINIYPAIETEEGYKIYDEDVNKFIFFNFNKLNENLSQKLDETGEVFLKLVRVFKNLYFNVNNSNLPSSYLIESLLYNCPSSLFIGKNFYEIFIKILNYLYNINLQAFVLISDNDKKLFSNDLISESLAGVHTFIKKIDEMI